MSWERWWMDGGQYMVFGCVDECLLWRSKRASKEKDDTFFAVRDCFDNSIRKVFSSELAVRCSLRGLDCQDSIEQKHSLCRSTCEISVSRHCLTCALFDLFVDVFERWRDCHWFRDRKRKSHSLFGSMIGILSEDNDFEIVSWCLFKGIEDQWRWWIDCCSLLYLFCEMLVERDKIRLCWLLVYDVLSCRVHGGERNKVLCMLYRVISVWRALASWSQKTITKYLCSLKSNAFDCW